MKLDQLRTVIREEVKTAIKEELQEIMNEAVRAASEPEKQTFYEEAPYGGYKGPHTTNLASTRETTENLQESGDPIMDILNQTQANMTSGNHNTPSQPTHDMVNKPNFASMMASNMGMNENAGPLPGIDLSQLDFVKKAGAIYNKSIENDKQKHGI
tara:strand:+ start:837 stop:1304 length:468 start_codon:yes stop_codon:yes gene_type:complete